MNRSLMPLLRRAAAWANGAIFLVATACSGVASAATPIPTLGIVATTPFEVRVVGAGPDVLLIPGLASSGATWDGVVAHLSPHFRCHVFTLAGFAGVPAVAGPPLDNAEAAIDAYVHAQHLRTPLVIGHSLGGFVALRLAIDHPADVGKLVIVDALPALGASRMDSLTPAQLHQFAEQMRQQLNAQDDAHYAAAQASQIATLVTTPADVSRVQAWGRDSDRATVVAAMVDMLGDDLRPQLRRVHAPTLVLGSWAAYKDVSTLEASRAIYVRQYADLAGVRIDMAPTARHFIMLDDPAWFDATLDAFLP